MGLSITFNLKFRGTRREAVNLMRTWQARVLSDNPHVVMRGPQHPYVGFVFNPGAGCEHPRFRMRWEGGLWLGGDSCKTQYAAEPNAGGIPNFLKAHKLLIGVLDIGRELGVVEQVWDDGDYWETRSEENLLKNLRNNQAMVAWLVGQIKDTFPADGVESPARDNVRFEQLEAEGAELIRKLNTPSFL